MRRLREEQVSSVKDTDIWQEKAGLGWWNTADVEVQQGRWRWGIDVGSGMLQQDWNQPPLEASEDIDEVDSEVAQTTPLREGVYERVDQDEGENMGDTQLGSTQRQYEPLSQANMEEGGQVAALPPADTHQCSRAFESSLPLLQTSPRCPGSPNSQISVSPPALCTLPEISPVSPISPLNPFPDEHPANTPTDDPPSRPATPSTSTTSQIPSASL